MSGNEVGLTDYLTTDMELEEVVMQTKVDNLYFFPAAASPPIRVVGILNSCAWWSSSRRSRVASVIIFLDSRPILGVSDAWFSSSAIDLTIIIGVQHRRNPYAMLQRVKQRRS